jgi:hypothetical protein
MINQQKIKIKAEIGKILRGSDIPDPPIKHYYPFLGCAVEA